MQYIFTSESLALADPNIEITNQSNVKSRKPSLRELNWLEVGGVRRLFYSLTKFQTNSEQEKESRYLYDFDAYDIGIDQMQFDDRQGGRCHKHRNCEEASAGCYLFVLQR